MNNKKVFLYFDDNYAYIQSTHSLPTIMKKDGIVLDYFNHREAQDLLEAMEYYPHGITSVLCNGIDDIFYETWLK